MLLLLVLIFLVILWKLNLRLIYLIPISILIGLLWNLMGLILNKLALMLRHHILVRLNIHLVCMLACGSLKASVRLTNAQVCSKISLKVAHIYSCRHLVCKRLRLLWICKRCFMCQVLCLLLIQSRSVCDLILSCYLINWILTLYLPLNLWNKH